VKNWINKTVASGGLLLCLGLSGCLFVDDDDDTEVAPVGTLTVRWTIDGLRDPLDCFDFAADRMEIRLYEGRSLIDEVEPICEDFSTTIELFDGVYSADATLVDSFDSAVTLTEPLEDIDIIEGTDLVIDIDFPIESFL
jgi:hypothetical protein